MESTEGPPRKYYKLTTKGTEHKDELVHEWQLFAKGVKEMIEEEE